MGRYVYHWTSARALGRSKLVCSTRKSVASSMVSSPRCMRTSRMIRHARQIASVCITSRKLASGNTRCCALSPPAPLRIARCSSRAPADPVRRRLAEVTSAQGGASPALDLGWLVGPLASFVMPKGSAERDSTQAHLVHAGFRSPQALRNFYGLEASFSLVGLPLAVLGRRALAAAVDDEHDHVLDRARCPDRSASARPRGRAPAPAAHQAPT